MKKLIVLFLAMYAAVTLRAQQRYDVVIDYTPEHIEILPGVFEFFGTIAHGSKKDSACYALSVNESLVEIVKDSLEAKRSQILSGPGLEKLVQEKVIDDYQKLRDSIERDAKSKIEEDTSFKEKAKDRNIYLQEKKNTKTYLAQLKQITERYKVRCIYVYGRKDADSTASAAKQDNAQKSQPQNSDKSKKGDDDQP